MSCVIYKIYKHWYTWDLLYHVIFCIMSSCILAQSWSHAACCGAQDLIVFVCACVQMCVCWWIYVYRILRVFYDMPTSSMMCVHHLCTFYLCHHINYPHPLWYRMWTSVWIYVHVISHVFHDMHICIYLYAYNIYNIIYDDMMHTHSVLAAARCRAHDLILCVDGYTYTRYCMYIILIVACKRSHFSLYICICLVSLSTYTLYMYAHTIILLFLLLYTHMMIVILMLSYV